MARMSNRDRIARAAEEAKASAAEKAVKKATKKPAGPRAARVTVPVRMKGIWEVCNVAGTAVETFPPSGQAPAPGQTGGPPPAGRPPAHPPPAQKAQWEGGGGGGEGAPAGGS